MGAVERLERRNQDYLLLETIKRVGVQNYSLLSRLTGLNPETIRYKVNKHLTKLGLNTTININYGELGLSVGYLLIKPNNSTGKSWLDELSYVIFSGKLIGTNRYFCLCAVPFRFKKKYMDVLEELRTRGLIDEFEMKDFHWVRYPPFRAELYDFDSRSWKIEWNRAGMFTKEIGPNFISVNRESTVDFIDLKILKAMLDDPTVPLAKAAKTMNANPRTVRYHHTEHVMRGKYILSSNIRWIRPIQEGNPGQLMQAVILFRRLDEQGIEKVRKFCNNLPFTWLEAGTEDRTYLALLDIPMSIFQESSQQIELNLHGVGDNYEMMMLDPAKTQPLGLPDEMFDKERGWRIFNFANPSPTRLEEGIK
jgi:hypothetical protein